MLMRLCESPRLDSEGTTPLVDFAVLTTLQTESRFVLLLRIMDLS